MAELFERDKSTISRHIKNVLSEGELVRESDDCKREGDVGSFYGVWGGKNRVQTVVYPDGVKMESVVLLDLDVTEIYLYSVSSVFSEKFEAAVSQRDAKNKYKDFYDIII